ncbi:MAG: 30S ribosomal protein S16 [Candidatus Babeliaceae bacterium]|nr:30S ribosomal protein S16 [Candidatus Babeliaceae bacterium]
MAVKIRLFRAGKKHIPSYRIVAIDSRCSRDGRALEVLGSYDPVKGAIVQFYSDRIDYWLGQGAQMSNAVKRIHKLHQKTAPAA